jgi:hypothetical protein
VARTQLEVVPLPLGAEGGAQVQRRAGLAGRAGLVPLGLEGKQGDLPDRLRAHRAATPRHPAQREFVSLEHAMDGFQVDLRRHVHHGAQLAVEPPVRFGRFGVALQELAELGEVRREVAGQVRQHGRGQLLRARAHAPARAREGRGHRVHGGALDPGEREPLGQDLVAGPVHARVHRAGHQGGCCPRP